MSAFPPNVRPLPARPSLAYERKQAKALLRRLRAGDPDALARARARHPGFDTAHPAAARLADAQLVLAREYGFASWPRLVRYYEAAERLLHRVRRSRASGPGGDVLARAVRHLLARHGAGDAQAARQLAAYVPRFYGLRPEAALAATVSEDDARLAVARQYGFASWEAAQGSAGGQEKARRQSTWEGIAPEREADAAIAAGDLTALERVVATHPELLRPGAADADDEAVGRPLVAAAIRHERRLGANAMRPILDWLAARGGDRQRELNAQLCGHLHMTADEVRTLLAQGADPHWVAPNGIPVLEHALLRYWNGEAVDVLAARARPRRALWIAAGLGDVAGVRAFLDSRGRPTPAARRLRPDFDAAGLAPIPALPEADDEELLVEALLVAVLNGRTAVIEALAARGAPVNSLLHGSPLLNIAVGNALTAAVEGLVRAGADLDLRGRQPDMTPRELARALFEQRPDDAGRRRILVLCGLDPVRVLAERDARPVPPPTRLPVFEEVLALAADDASRAGETAVRPEHLLVGLLRLGGAPLALLVSAGRMELERLRADMADRLHPPGDRGEHAAIAMHPDAQAAVDAAVALATERRQDMVHGVHLLAALLRDALGPVAPLLARYGVDQSAVREALQRAL
jgi:hypothetical protein